MCPPFCLPDKIRRPLLELNLAAKKIADNDLDFEIGYQSKDELGVLCREFDHMKEELAHEQPEDVADGGR